MCLKCIDASFLLNTLFYQSAIHFTCGVLVLTTSYLKIIVIGFDSNPEQTRISVTRFGKILATLAKCLKPWSMF